MTAMNISSINNTVPAQKTAEDGRLKEACSQFEGLLLGMVLRESMSAQKETESPGNGVMMEFASEQLAQSISTGGGIGIAEQLYQQIINGGKRG